MNGGTGPLRVDTTIARLAAGQLGLVTVRQAIAAGIDRSALDRRRRSGVLVPAANGVLRLSSHEPMEAQRMLVGGLAIEGSLIIGPAAALVEGFPVGRVDEPVVLVPQGASGRVAGITAVRSGSVLPSRPWCGSRLTTATSTVVTLARFVTGEVLERCLDHCLVTRRTTVTSVRALVHSLPPRTVTGRGTLLDLLAERESGRHRHRSGLEQQVAGWLRRAGLDGWQPNAQIPVGSGNSIEGDFVWVPCRAVLEVSPFVTHGSRVAQERDAERRRLLVAAGWRVVEATDVHLADQRAFRACVDSLRQLGVGRGV